MLSALFTLISFVIFAFDRHRDNLFLFTQQLLTFLLLVTWVQIRIKRIPSNRNCVLVIVAVELTVAAFIVGLELIEEY